MALFREAFGWGGFAFTHVEKDLEDGIHPQFQKNSFNTMISSGCNRDLPVISRKAGGCQTLNPMGQVTKAIQLVRFDP